MLNKKNLKITVISHSYPNENFPVWGIYVKDQTKWLSSKAEVQVYAPRPKTLSPFYFKKKWFYYSKMPRESISDSIKVFRPDYLTLPGQLFVGQRGKKFKEALLPILNDEPDIFHVHFAYPDACIIPELKEKYSRVPVVLSIHGSDWYNYWNNKYVNNQLRNNLEYSDKILTVGGKLKDDIIKAYPQLEQKIQVLHNGVDFSEANIREQNIKTFKKKNKIKILVVANYVECKGINYLLNAMSTQIEHDYEMIVIGRNVTPKYYRYLCNLKKKLRLDSKIKFMYAMPRKKLMAFYRDCDFLVLPSIREGFGIVLIEALAQGKPVVSTKSGGPEDIINESNGLIAESSDVNSLSESIKKMFVNYKEYDSQSISEDIRRRFSAESVRDNLLEIYSELLEKS